MADRPKIDVPTPPGGWGEPWPNVAEIEAVVPHDTWTLGGGLVTQLHAIHRGVDAIRPTNDVDIVLHVDTARGVAARAAVALESLGYVLTPSIDDRNNTAHRFKRGTSTVDVVASDVVDVLVADHAAPSVMEKLRGRTWWRSLAVPRPYGALSMRDWRSCPAVRRQSRSRTPSVH